MSAWPLLPISDAALVKGTLGNDPRAFEGLVARYQRKASALARALGVATSDVDDVLQHAFLQAFRSLRQLRDPARFRPWFLNIVRNAARGHLRRTRRNDVSPLPHAIEGESEDTLAGRELRDLLWGKVSRLPEGIREAVFLYYQDGESVGAVAKALGISRSAVKMRLRRGREALRRDLWDEFEDSLRGELPSPKELHRRARTLSLLALTSAADAKEPAAAVLGPTQAATLLSLGGLIMTAKKIAVVFCVSLCLFSGLLFYTLDPLGWRGERGSPTEPSETVKPPAGASSTAPLKTGAERLADGPATVERKAVSPSLPKLSGPLFGLVVYPDGRTAPGTDLSAYGLENRRSTRPRWNPNPPEVRADEKGLFVFPRLEPGRYSVEASSPEGLRALVPDVLVPSSEPLRVVLQEGVLLEGRVTSTEGRPVPEAAVTISSMMPPPDPRIPLFGMEILSDGEGGFRVRGLPAGTYRLGASAPGHWRGSEVVELPLEEPAVLRLKPATYIAGRACLRDRAHPLRNARISLMKDHPTGAGGDSITTNEEGEFLSYPLMSGDHVLTLKYESFRPVTLSLNLTEERPASDLEVIFVDGITVEGTVSNSEGVPLPWAPLSYRMVGAPYGRKLDCTSDREGRFKLKGLEPGRCRVVLHVVFPGRRRSEQEIEVDDTTPQWMDLVFDVLAPILIQVIDSRGEPVVGMQVRYHFHGPIASHTRSVSASLLTHEDGLTALLGFPRRGSLTLSAGRRELGSGRLKVDLPQVNPPILLRLEPWGTITGKVVDREGSPVPGAGVEVREAGQQATSDDEGDFELELPSGEWDLAVSSAQLGRTVVKGIPVEAGKTVEPLTVALGEDNKGKVRGRVLTLEGEPIRGVEVFIESPQRRQDHRRVSTDREGWFSVRLDGGPYVIRVRHTDHFLREHVRDVRPGDPPLEIRMGPKPVRIVAGEVIHQGAPVEGATVKLYRLPGGTFPTIWGSPEATDRKGRFEIEGIEPSCERAIVVAQSPQFAFARSEEFAVPPEGRLEGIQVSSVPGLDFEFQALKPEGQPVAGARVSLTSTGKPPVVAHGLTDGSGRWRLLQLPPGDYRMVVHSERLSSRVSKRFTWKSTSDPVTVQLLPGTVE